MIDPKAPIVELLQSSRFVFKTYLSDLHFDELCQAPVDGSNPILWQIGHVIVEELLMMQLVAEDSRVKLPEDFVTLHRRRLRTELPPSVQDVQRIRDLYTMVQYENWMAAVRESTLSTLARLPVELLSSPGPEKLRSYAPTVSSVFVMIGAHEYLHAGQIAVLRRKLGKQVLI